MVGLRQRRLVGTLIAATVAVGCNLLSGASDLESNGGQGALTPDGAVNVGEGSTTNPGLVDGANPTPTDGNNPTPVVDANKADVVIVTPPETGPTKCEGGAQTVIPIALFDATPAADGETCNLANALVADGQVAGLDRANDGANLGKIAGYDVNGCIGAEFDPSVALGNITLRLQTMPKGCSSSCGPCARASDVWVYGGPSRSLGAMKVIGEPNVTSTLVDYTLAIPTQGLHVIIVCRQAYGQNSDDVGLDAISAACPPP